MPSSRALPKVSVLMPAYNTWRTIDEAIQSVLGQRGVSFELLIGDDASTDETWDRIRVYLKDPRVRAWRFQRHRGLPAVRNRLAAHARGKYLSGCDADDVLLARALNRCAHVLDRCPEVGVAYGGWLYVDGRGGFLKRRPPCPDHHIWALRLFCDTAYSCGTMFRRSLCLKVGGYRTRFLWGEHELLLRLAEVTSFQAVAGGPIYGIRKHSGSYTAALNRSQKRLAWQRVLRETIHRRYGYRVPW